MRLVNILGIVALAGCTTTPTELRGGAPVETFSLMGTPVLIAQCMEQNAQQLHYVSRTLGGTEGGSFQTLAYFPDKDGLETAAVADIVLGSPSTSVKVWTSRKNRIQDEFPKALIKGC